MGEAAGGGRPSGTFGRSRGTVFLVDRAANRVIWSTYVLPRSRRPDELNRVADQIVERLDGAAGKQEKRIRKEQAKSVPAPSKP
jgi:hypothetical protein